MQQKTTKAVAAKATALNPSDVQNDHDDSLSNAELLKVLTEVKNGNFSIRMPFDKLGISGKICDTLNEIISLNEILTQELETAKHTIGK